MCRKNLEQVLPGWTSAGSGLEEIFPMKWSDWNKFARLSTPMWRSLVCILILLVAASCVVDESGQVVPSVPALPSSVVSAEPVAVERPASALPEKEAEDEAEGLETGFTADGYPFLGSPEAPIVLIEYSDFHCPFCRQHNQETLPLYREQFIQSGMVQYVAKDFPLETLHPDARAAHRAAWCVALQSTDAFWWMHDQLYATQTQHARTDDAAAFYEALVVRHNEQQAGVESIDVGAFMTCQVDYSNEVNERIDISIQTAVAAGFNGTPTFVLHFRDQPERALPLRGAYEYDVFVQVTENLGEFLDQMEADTSELPFWVTDVGLAPARVWETQMASASETSAALPAWEGVTVAQDYFQGSPFAEVVVFEFSDFECPYCLRHQQETQPALHEAYISTHKIMWVYKHFPLSIHRFAPFASEAALCAGEQGRFWDMHAMLFADPEAWAHRNYAPVLQTYGQQLAEAGTDMVEVVLPPDTLLGADPVPSMEAISSWPREPLTPFDAAAYQTCLESNEFEASIAQGMQDVEGIIRGTPTFLIWHRHYGILAQPIVGSLQESQFISVFEQIFAQLAELEDSGP